MVGRSAHGRIVAVITTVVAGLMTAAPLWAQQQITPRRGPVPEQLKSARQVRRSPPSGAVIDVSAPLANLLVRAEEGIARRDWKFAIDSLQRIIDHSGGSLVPRAETAGDREIVYESMRRQATRRIATLPPQGLATYRLLYDGKAKRLFDRARAASDAAGLRAVVDRYLLTRYGDDAADLLASWALDAGRSVEAARVLEDLRELIPDPDVPERLVAAKLAAAYVQLGDLDKADAVVASLKQLPSQTSADWLANLTRTLARDPASVSPSANDVRAWPTLGGSSTRTGRMPAVAPDLVDPLPWIFRLPGPAGKLWPRALPTDLRDPLVLPASNLVADDERLFVRTLRGCAALDVESLSLKWIAPPTDFDPDTGEALLLGSGSSSDQGESLADRVFADQVAESITVTNGLVLTIERQRTEVLLGGQDAASGVTLPGIGLRDTGGPGEGATVLVARDSATGVVQWERGRTSDVADPLGDVDFRAVPLGVDDDLWVPYIAHGDLFLGVLSAEDGSSIADILLCSISIRDLEAARRGRREYFLGEALTPAYAQGVVFVPSGHGVLFAADATQRQLRWANRYRQSSGGPQGRSSQGLNGWLSSPPVVAGGLVLLAPSGDDKVLAFSAATGFLRWSARVSGGSYIIAADEGRVWLGGTSVTCLSVLDGTQLWSTSPTSVPSGRGVLAGDVIYVPTVEGLVAMDAASGDNVRGQALPLSAVPLGNLLCLRSSMFSLEPSSVRRYPDLGRLYPEMRERHAGAPADVGVSLQLGWLEVLRHQPGRALDLLDAIPQAALEQDHKQLDDVAHLRVEALLASAEQPTVDPSEASSMLRRAQQAARTSADRLRSGLALADRLDATGLRAETCRTLWEIGLSSDADRAISLGDDVEGDARHFIARRLRQVEPKLRDDEVAAIQQYVEEEVARAVRVLSLSTQGRDRSRSPRDAADARRAAARLRRVADVSPRSRSCQYALIELAGYRLARQQLEQAEQLLSNVARSDLDADATITALMHLARLYAEPAQQQPALLGTCLDELDRRFATVPTPDMFYPDVSTWPREPRMRPTSESAEGSGPEGPSSEQTVGDWVAEFRAGALARGSEIAESARAPDRSGFHSARGSGVEDVTEAPDRSGFHSARGSGVPESARAAVGDAPWRARSSLRGRTAPHLEPFQLAGDVAWSVRATTHGRSRAFAPFDLPDILRLVLNQIDTSGPPRQVRFPGEVPSCLSDRAVFYAPGDVIYCQDVSSGELVWYTRLGIPDRLSEGVRLLRAPPVGISHRALADGQTGVFSGRNGLHAVGLATGKRLWVRPYDYTGLPAASSHGAGYTRMPDTAMAARDGLIAAVPEPGRLALLRLADGESVWERDLHGERVAHVWLTDATVVTADVWLQRVHLFDKRDGTLIKQIAFSQPDPESPLLVQHVHTGRIVCGPDCSARSDGVVAVDLTTGEPVWRLTLDKPLIQLFRPQEGYVGIGLLGGDVRIVDAVTGDVILDSRVLGAHLVFDGALADGTLVVKYLAAQDTSAPPELTGFDMETGTVLWHRADLAQAMRTTPLRIVAGTVPVVVRAEFLQEGPRKGSSLALIDLRTGVDVGPSVPIPFGEGGVRFNGDLAVYPGRVIAGTTHGIHAFSTELVGNGKE